VLVISWKANIVGVGEYESSSSSSSKGGVIVRNWKEEILPFSTIGWFEKIEEDSVSEGGGGKLWAFGENKANVVPSCIGTVGFDLVEDAEVDVEEVSKRGALGLAENVELAESVG